MNSWGRKTNDPTGRKLSRVATILLVEDEATVREVTREALEMAGYRVIEANDPEEAARIAKERSTEIDLLLTDIVMPGMTGTELARRVCESRPETITLFMSGYAESEVPRASAQGLVRNHIQKPFTVDGLLSFVAEALEARGGGPAEYQATQCSSS